MSEANELLVNQERSYRGRNRFTKMYDLHSRYLSIKEAVQAKRKEPWEKFLKEYDKRDTIIRSGNGQEFRNVNFGQFRMKMNRFIELFSDLVLERDKWCNIRLIDVPDETQRKLFSSEVTKCFQEYCIKAWCDRQVTVYQAIRDMTLFSCGIDHWPDPYCLYPKNIPVSRVYPDSNASRNPDEWDLLFIEDTMTLMEIFQMVEDDDPDTLEGWDRDTVLEMIRGSTDHYGSYSDNDIMEQWIDGGVDNKSMDLTINLVFAYVREYKKDEEGYRISHYVFPQSGRYEKSQGEGRSSGFLREVPRYCECMSNVVAVRGHQVTRSYYETPSEAELVYSACMLYNQTMNKAVRAVNRSSNTYLSSPNVDVQKKIANIDPRDEVLALPPDVDFREKKLTNETKGLVETMRQIMIDTDAGSMAGLVTGSQNVKGRPITAEEAKIQQQEASQNSKMYIDMFVVTEQRYMKELYRRFIDDSTSGSEAFEGNKFKKLFKKKMKALGLKKKDYDLDNVLITPAFSSSVGSKSMRVQNSIQMLAALRALANASTPAEELVIRDWLAALDSYDNVDSYMGDDKSQFADTHIAKAGLENAGMSNPLENRRNFPVDGNDKHLIEIPVHLQDYEYKLNIAEGLIQQYQNTPMNLQPFVLDDAVSITIALDNLGGHIIAHINEASKDETLDKGILKEFQNLLAQYQQKEHQIEQALKQIQEQVATDSEQSAINSEKLRHLQQENQEKERHSSEKNQIDKLKSLSKMQAAQQGSEEKKAQSIRHKQVDHTLDTSKKLIDIQLEQEKQAIKNSQLTESASRTGRGQDRE